MQIRIALSDAQWLIAKGGTDRAETLNRVLGKIGNVLNDWWCRTGDLLKKEHRELYWR